MTTTVTTYPGVPRHTIAAHKKNDDDLETLDNFREVDDFDVQGQIIYDCFRILGVVIVIFLAGLASIYITNIIVAAELIKAPLITVLNTLFSNHTAPSAVSHCNLTQINTCVGNTLPGIIKFAQV